MHSCLVNTGWVLFCSDLLFCQRVTVSVWSGESVTHINTSSLHSAGPCHINTGCQGLYWTSQTLTFRRIDLIFCEPVEKTIFPIPTCHSGDSGGRQLANQSPNTAAYWPETALHKTFDGRPLKHQTWGTLHTVQLHFCIQQHCSNDIIIQLSLKN